MLKKWKLDWILLRDLVFMLVFGTLNVIEFWFDVFGFILNVVLAIQFKKNCLEIGGQYTRKRMNKLS